MRQFRDVYAGKRVLITGHTGFKGSWLALWLHKLGAVITGIALPPETEQAHWNLLELPITSYSEDLRDREKVMRIVQETNPEIIFHLAAQSLVRRSYKDPLMTWETNVTGSANLLEASRRVNSLKAIVFVTTDKVYENREWPWPYRENDRLGGHDPYSASKAGAELLAASYRHAFFHTPESPLLATARAGNVIGGGDWSQDRLIPDLMRAIQISKKLNIRFPDAVRPWQHVLDPLAGYLLLGGKLMEGRREFAGAWNFGPRPDELYTVEDILHLMQQEWPDIIWKQDKSPQYHEANTLLLDTTKSRNDLGWQPVWDTKRALRETSKWYRAYCGDNSTISTSQLEQYTNEADNMGQNGR